MSFEVENFAVGLVYLSVTVRPNACFLKFQEGMHPCSKQVRIVLALKKIVQFGNSLLHDVFEDSRGLKGFVRFDFHNVQLKFFSKSKIGFLDEIDDSSVIVLHYLIHDWQGFQFIVDHTELMFWT